MKLDGGKADAVLAASLFHFRKWRYAILRNI
jgi:imidazole glycerol phosphate synthase subunit HisF